MSEESLAGKVLTDRARWLASEHADATARLSDVLAYKMPCNLDLDFTPHPKQQAFLCLDDQREVLFGGAAGGGKSAVILIAALQYACIPGYNATLFRRTYPQLSQEDGLIDRSKELLAASGAVYNEQKHRWTFPSGANLSFNHLQRVTERTKFQVVGCSVAQHKSF